MDVLDHWNTQKIPFNEVKYIGLPPLHMMRLTSALRPYNAPVPANIPTGCLSVFFITLRLYQRRWQSFMRKTLYSVCVFPTAGKAFKDVGNQ